VLWRTEITHCSFTDISVLAIAKSSIISNNSAFDTVYPQEDQLTAVAVRAVKTLLTNAFVCTIQHIGSASRVLFTWITIAWISVARITCDIFQTSLAPLGFFAICGKNELLFYIIQR